LPDITSHIGPTGVGVFPLYPLPNITSHIGPTGVGVFPLYPLPDITYHIGPTGVVVFPPCHPVMETNPFTLFRIADDGQRLGSQEH
jgi:hypothetical protein